MSLAAGSPNPWSACMTVPERARTALLALVAVLLVISGAWPATSTEALRRVRARR
jgi:hypothetical protein